MEKFEENWKEELCQRCGEGPVTHDVVTEIQDFYISTRPRFTIAVCDQCASMAVREVVGRMTVLRRLVREIPKGGYSGPGLSQFIDDMENLLQKAREKSRC